MSETKSLVVTTAKDVVDESDGVTSLREAVAYAKELGGKQTVTFKIEGSDTITISSAIDLGKSISINGLKQATGNNITIKVPVTYAESISSEGKEASNFRVFTSTSDNMDITLENLTIQGGKLKDTEEGGAVSFDTNNTAGTITVKNCTFSDSCAGVGGAVSIRAFSGSDISFDNCKFLNNKSTAEDSQSDEENQEPDTLGGGAVRVYTIASADTVKKENEITKILINNSIFTGNEAAEYGGAILLDGDSDEKYDPRTQFTVINTSFVDNKSDCGKESGSAIYLATYEKEKNCEQGDLSNRRIRLINTTVVCNKGDQSVMVKNCFVTVVNSIITANYSTNPTDTDYGQSGHNAVFSGLIVGNNNEIIATVANDDMDEVFAVAKENIDRWFEIGNGVYHFKHVNGGDLLQTGTIVQNKESEEYTPVLCAINPYASMNDFNEIYYYGTNEDGKKGWYQVKIVTDEDGNVGSQKELHDSVDPSWIITTDQTGADRTKYNLLGALLNETPSLVVTTKWIGSYNKGDGVISLQDAIEYAKSGTRAADGTATITFDSSIEDSSGEIDFKLKDGDKITISSGYFPEQKLTIDGGGKVTITGSGSGFDIGVDNNVIFKDMQISSVISNDGTLYFDNCKITDNTGIGSAYIGSSSVITSTTLKQKDHVYITNDGSAHTITLSSSGTMEVKTGGSAENTTVNEQGTLAVTSGGYVKETSVNSAGTMEVQTGGSAENTTVNAQGTLAVTSGGYVNKTSVNSAGTMEVQTGGSADSTTINSAGSMAVAGSAEHTEVNQGKVTVTSGGIVKITTLNTSGTMEVQAGGSADSTTVNDQGKLTVTSGGYVDGTIIKTSGSMTAAGSAEHTEVNQGKVTVTSGGYVKETIINTSGTMAVAGFAENTTINDQGNLSVTSGGIVKNVTVYSGAAMNVFNGGTITGSLQISGGVVSAYSGATIDFAVAEQQDPGTAFINNWSLIQGNDAADYTITVDANTGYNTYRLADGAGDFDKTITVKNTNGAIAGNVSLSKDLTYGNRRYSLSKENGQLSLMIAADGDPITITANDGSKMYDGNALTDTGYTYTGSLATGDYFDSVTVEGTITDAGTTANKVTGWVIKNQAGDDVTSFYSNIQTVDGKLEVTKRDIKLTSDSAKKSYDGTPLTNSTVTVTGDNYWVAGEGASYNVTGSQTDVGSSDNAFTYTLNEGTKAGNYNITTVNGTLEVVKNTKVITITASSDKKTYDGTALSNNGFTYTQGVLADGHTLKATVVGTITDAGEAANVVTEYHVIRDSDQKDVTDFYTFAASVNGTLTVNKRNVTLTSANDSKSYDGTALTNHNVTVNGFVTGEGATCNVTGSQTEVGSSSNTFTYTLNKNTKAGNYNITTVEGTLKVLKNTRPITITASSASKTYDGTALSNNGFTYTQGVLADGDQLVVTVEGSLTDAGTAGNVVTSYKVMRGKDDVTDFYTFAASVNGTLTVNKRNVTLTSAKDSKFYDGKALTNHNVTVDGDGFAAGEGATYNVTGSQTEVGSSPNTFTYTLNKNTKAGNYNITTEEGTLNVLSPIQITANSASKTYDGTALTNNGFSYTGDLAAGDQLVVTVEGTLTDAGTADNVVTSYKVMRGKDDVTDFYTFAASVNGTLTVDKRNVTLTSEDASKIYDKTPLTNPNVTVSGDGFADGEGATYTVTGSQTEVGSSSNTFTYTLNKNTKAGNYNITQVEGKLTVNYPPVTLEWTWKVNENGKLEIATESGYTIFYKEPNSGVWKQYITPLDPIQGIYAFKAENGSSVAYNVIDCYTGQTNGAIFNSDGDMSLSNVVFINNSAKWWGGAIYNKGSMILSNATFSGNSASWGGAIFNSKTGSITLTDAKFETPTDTVYNNGSMTFIGLISLAANLYTTTTITATDATLMFDISSYKQTNDTLIVSDITKIYGADYAICVDTDQTYASYKLAGNADTFAEEVTIKTAEGMDVGNISVGETLQVDDTSYSLNIKNNDLVFTVAASSADMTAPILFAWQTGSTVFASTEGSSQVSLQYKIDGAANWKNYNATTGVNVTSANSQVTFKATDTAGNSSDLALNVNTKLMSSTETAAGSQQIHWELSQNGQATVTIQDDDKTMSFEMDTENVSVLGAKTGMQFSVQDSQGKSLGKLELESTIPSGAEEKPVKMDAGKADSVTDIFFARTNGVWTKKYSAKHTGYLKGGQLYAGTAECVKLEGKNKICDIFSGAVDANVLFLTDDTNGDGLFVEDIYSESAGNLGQIQTRIAQIKEVYAGIGDDIVDMTTQRFEYTGEGITVHGGDGNDTIWATHGDNKLFGDAGNDRIVGADGNDVIAGGSGDDKMSGNGGSDIFCFCNDWGADTVEQLSDGTVTLWFESGSSDKWNKTTMTYTDGDNTVTVTGVSEVTLKFGDDQSEFYKTLASMDAFADKTSEKIFEEKDKSLVTSSK